MASQSVTGATGGRADAGPDPVLDAWFGDERDGRRDLPRRKRWFRGGRALDAALRERFGATIEAAGRGELDRWRESPDGTLALIVLLDQFPRHVHRGTAAAFAHDARALDLAAEGIARGHLARLPLVQAVFHVMPYAHDESLASQRRALELFGELSRRAPPELDDFARATLQSAEEHAAIIERFGRYPHRNAALGRPSSADERRWLAGRERRFGQ